MGSFVRILPYLWPYRRALVLSALCAVGVSMFWAANLSATLPVVQVLFQGKTLHDRVDESIESAEKDVALWSDQAHKQVGATPEVRPFRKGWYASAELQVLIVVRDYILHWVPRDRFQTLMLILAAVILGTVLKGAFVYLEDILVGDAINAAVVDVRKNCFRHALTLDYQTVSASGPAEMVSRLTNDIEVLAGGLHALLVRLIREPLKAGGCVLFAFVVNWRLTLLSILVLPAMGALFFRFGKSMKRASHGTLQSLSAISKCLVETFESMKAVIAFGAGRRHRRQFHQANKLYSVKTRKLLRIASLTRQSTEMMGVFAVMAAVFPGAYMVLNGTDKFLGIQLAEGVPDSASLAVLYALLAGTLDSVRKMSSVNRELRRGSAACERVLQIIDATTRVPEPKMARLLPRHSGDIRFENLTFSYWQANADAGARPPALKNVSLTIKAGEVVAVIGENGSGKSTLTNLIPRFIDPDQGTVLIDGIDIRQVSTRDLRRQISVVTQETLLFDDTIFENIRYGKPDATWEEVEEAARQAHVIPFITQLPDGFDTSIGEKGMKLSGGQRQRLALARAIIRDPAILILDEATSAIDSQSEQLIHNVLKSFVKGRTVFMITHAISDTFLDLVTRIVVMENGQVAATGTHGELLKTCPTYQRLYHAQSQVRAA